MLWARWMIRHKKLDRRFCSTLSKAAGGYPVEEVATMMLMTAAVSLFKDRPDFLDATHCVALAAFNED